MFSKLKRLDAVHFVQDPEAGVAQAAARALQALASQPLLLRAVLTQGSSHHELAALMATQDATVRSRCLACLIDCAATSPEAANAVLESGALCLPLPASNTMHVVHP